MKSQECTRERDVAIAASRGMIDDEIREHVRNCAACAETLGIARALGELNRTDEAKSPSISARVLWLKAQLAPGLAPSAAAESATRRSMVVWIVVAAIWTVLITWRWDDLRGLADRLSVGEIMVSGGSLQAIPVASLVVVGAMVAVTMAIMLHQVFVEEL